MGDNSLLDRITSDPRVLGGKPAIRGTRLSVEFILGLLAHGATQAEILAEYAGLVPEDVAACLLFASRSLASAAPTPPPGSRRRGTRFSPPSRSHAGPTTTP